MLTMKPLRSVYVPGVIVICDVPKIWLAACCVLASANCWPWDVFAAMAIDGNDVLLAIMVCGWAILAMLTIGVAWTWTGAIDTAFITCCCSHAIK